MTLIAAISCKSRPKASEIASSSRHDGGGYRVCPGGADPCRVLPLGDSITDAYNAPGGYRIELYRAALREGKRIRFVGSQSNGPERVDGYPFPRAHEGHSGYTIDEAPAAERRGLLGIAEQAVRDSEPNIVLLMIGTNDVSLDLDLQHAPARLARLIDTILRVDPTLLLVVAELPPTRNDALNLRISGYNAALAGLVAERVAAGRHLLLVDMNAAFTRDASYKATLLEDDLHPNPAGYDRLGQAWYAALRNVLH